MKNHAGQTIIFLHDIHTIYRDNAQLEKIKTELTKLSKSNARIALLLEDSREIPASNELSKVHIEMQCLLKANRQEIIEKIYADLINQFSEEDLTLPQKAEIWKIISDKAQDLLSAESPVDEWSLGHKNYISLADIPQSSNITVQSVDYSLITPLPSYSLIDAMFTLCDLQAFGSEYLKNLSSSTNIKLNSTTPREVILDALNKQLIDIDALLQKQSNAKVKAIYMQHKNNIQKTLKECIRNAPAATKIPMQILAKEIVITSYKKFIEKIDKPSLFGPMSDILYPPSPFTKILRKVFANYLCGLTQKLAVETITEPLAEEQCLKFYDEKLINLASPQKSITFRPLDLVFLHHIFQADDVNKFIICAEIWHCENLMHDLQELGYHVTHDSKLSCHNGNSFKNSEAFLIRTISTNTVLNNEIEPCMISRMTNQIKSIEEFDWMSLDF